MTEFSDEQYMKQLDKYRQKLIDHVLSLMDKKNKDADEAEDIVQEVFCRVWRVVRAKREPFFNEEAYLYTSVKRLYFRKIGEKAKNISISSDEAGGIIDPREQPEQLAELHEQSEARTDQIRAISQASIQRAMDLFRQGYSIREISEELHIQISTTYDYITKGRGLLRRSSTENGQD